MARSAPPLERRVLAGGIELSVREWPGSGRPILCLHGLASNARWWDALAARLSPAHPVIAVDLRGHGRSDRPEHGYSFPEVAGDVKSLLHQRGLAAPLVVGHSWGASVALWLAAEAPEVAGVLCVDGGAMDLRAHFGADWEQARERMRPPRMDRLDQARLRSWAASSHLSQEIGEEAATAALMGNFEEGRDGWLRPRLDMGRHLEIAQALYELDQERLWARVPCPVRFLMAGGGGPSAKRQAVERACQLLPGGAQARFIDGQHDLPLQRPAAVAAAVEEFAAELPRG